MCNRTTGEGLSQGRQGLSQGRQTHVWLGSIDQWGGQDMVWPCECTIFSYCAKHSSPSMGDKMRSQEVGRDKEESLMVNMIKAT